MARKPNVVVILADDLGFGDLSVHGNAYMETPNLDALAADSVRFDECCANPLCAPSRAALMTGRDYLRTGVWGVHGAQDYLDLGETTLAQTLQSNGYRTGMFGKWHLGKTNLYLPHNRGFAEAWLAKLYVHADNEMNYNGTDLVEPLDGSRFMTEPLNTDSFFAPSGTNVSFRGWTTERLTDLSINFVRKHRSEPFFLYLPYLAPHGPWEAPETLVEKYRAKGLSPSLSTVFGMIDQLDGQIGRLLAALDEYGLSEDTIVVFLSDNGPTAGSGNKLPHLTDAEMGIRTPDGRRGRKGNIYDNGMHVPLFVRWTGRLQPSRVKEYVHINDIFPTLLELTNTPLLEKNRPLDGVSLCPLLEGKADRLQPRRLHHAETSPGVIPDRKTEYDPVADKNDIRFEGVNLAVRTEEYKYIEHADRLTGELFHITEDPGERRDLSGVLPEHAASLNDHLKNWFEGILREPPSYGKPVFHVGLPDEPRSFVFANGMIKKDGNVYGKERLILGWQSPGDSFSLLVHVVEEGLYDVFLDASGESGVRFELRIGDEASEIGAGESRVFRCAKGLTELKLTLTSYIPKGISFAVRGFEWRKSVRHEIGKGKE